MVRKKTRQDALIDERLVILRNPNDDSIYEVICLALDWVAKKWMMPIRNWRVELNQFIIVFV